MNKVDDKVIKRVLDFIDFSNTENNKKKEYNKRDKFRNRKNWQDDKDILTQLTILFYNRLEDKPTTIIQSQENLEIQRENIKLLKENDNLLKELESYKNTRQQNIKNRKIIDEKQIEIYNLQLHITQLKEQIKTLENKDNDSIDKSVFDDEPNKDINEAYDPYTNDDSNEPTKMTLQDYSKYEIGQAKFTYGGEFWDTCDDEQKLTLLLQLN